MPSYRHLYESGELKQRVEKAKELWKSCNLCPRNCGVDRSKGELGICRTGASLKISSVLPHFGEEPPLTGEKGAGAVFFSSCNLRCLHCQNYEISWETWGKDVQPEKLAGEMIRLQEAGCHNIDLVSPTHMVPQLLQTIELAADMGLRLPLVYNSGGYDSLHVLKLLDGVIDIYLPDMKYADEAVALRLSGVKQYPYYNRLAVKEMFRQVGPLQTDKKGVAKKGLLIRHLILPNGLSGSFSTLAFIRDELPRETPVSLMSQYHPSYKAKDDPQLQQALSRKEYDSVMDKFEELGLTEGYQQELSASHTGLPAFRDRADSPFVWEDCNE